MSSRPRRAVKKIEYSEMEVDHSEDSIDENDFAQRSRPKRILKAKSSHQSESNDSDGENDLFATTKRSSPRKTSSKLSSSAKSSSKTLESTSDSDMSGLDSDSVSPISSKRKRSSKILSDSSSSDVETKKNPRRRQKTSESSSSPRRSVRNQTNHQNLYVEPDSDDEFAKAFFMLPEDDVNERKTKTKTRKQSKSEVGDMKQMNEVSESVDIPAVNDGEDVDIAMNEDDEVDGEIDDEDDDNLSTASAPEYRIQYILGRQSMTASAWRKICDSMDTQEVTHGSVWKQPHEEYYDESNIEVEKFLIKWVHASFLHVSWETEKDLLDIVGSSVKSQLKKFRKREELRLDLFEDLRWGEYFPPSFVEVERILEVNDSHLSLHQIDWKNGKMPTDAFLEATRSEGIKKIASKVSFLHSGSCWVVVKWEGLPYSDITWENVDDLRRRNLDYEIPLRAYYRRESLTPVTLESMMHRAERRLTSDWSSSTPPSCVSVGNGVYSSSNNSNGTGMTCQLRDYQWEGVRWLLYNWSQHRNSILADEMGLGKTIQTASFLQFLHSSQRRRGPFLIIAPLSTLINWQRELTTWTEMDVIVYHGSQEDRKLIRDHEFFASNASSDHSGENSRSSKKKSNQHSKTGGKETGMKIEIVVTTPETCLAYDTDVIGGMSGSSGSSGSIGSGSGSGSGSGNNSGGTSGSSSSGGRLRRELARIPWEMVIIDEAHRLKNYDSKIASTLREDYSFDGCVLLTGTPLQNNMEELWSLLHFIDRQEFEDRNSFLAQFGDLKTSTQLTDLFEHIRPYLLRREKDLVEKNVPPKTEVIVEVEMTLPQKQYYRALFEQKTGFLYRGGAKDGPNLTNLAMELRKCCNHPYLIKGAPAELTKYFSNQSPLEILIQSSGKLILLDKLLPKLQKDGHRVLIFSQFRMMLNLLEDYLSGKGYSYERVDGTITGRKRQAAIDRYSRDYPVGTSSFNGDVPPQAPVFAMLLSTRAGGVGINLTAADTVIIFDSDWNPQNDVQAQARAHRIGQTRAVTVYRLLTRKTYEAAMFRAASLKLGLDYAVLHQINQSSQVSLQLPEDQSGESTSATNKNMTSSSMTMAGISDSRAETWSALSKKELENLLKHGAYDIFKEEREGQSAEESLKFCQEDIEAILNRSSVLVHEEASTDANTNTNANANANTNTKAAVTVKTPINNQFSKATFISSRTNEEDVAIDDPEFWSKVVGMPVDGDDGDGDGDGDGDEDGSSPRFGGSLEDRGKGKSKKFARKCKSKVSSYKEGSWNVTKGSVGSSHGSKKNGDYGDEHEEDSDDSRSRDSGAEDSDNSDRDGKDSDSEDDDEEDDDEEEDDEDEDDMDVVDSKEELNEKYSSVGGKMEGSDLKREDGMATTSDEGNRTIHSSNKKKRKRKKKISPVWNSDNLQKMTNAILSRGYGKWKDLQTSSRLHWSLLHTIQGCRLAILRQLLLAGLSAQPNLTKRRKFSWDVSYLENYLLTHRMSRWVVVALLRGLSEQQDSLLLHSWTSWGKKSMSSTSVKEGDLTSAESLEKIDLANQTTSDAISIGKDLQSPTDLLPSDRMEVDEDTEVSNVASTSTSNDTEKNTENNLWLTKACSRKDWLVENESKDRLSHLFLDLVQARIDEGENFENAKWIASLPLSSDDLMAEFTRFYSYLQAQEKLSNVEEKNVSHCVLTYLLEKMMSELDIAEDVQDLNSEKVGKLRIASRNKLAQMEDMFLCHIIAWGFHSIDHDYAWWKTMFFVSSSSSSSSNLSPQSDASASLLTSCQSWPSVNLVSSLHLPLFSDNMTWWSTIHDVFLVKVVYQVGAISLSTLYWIDFFFFLFNFLFPLLAYITTLLTLI